MNTVFERAAFVGHGCDKGGGFTRGGDGIGREGFIDGADSGGCGDAFVAELAGGGAGGGFGNDGEKLLRGQDEGRGAEREENGQR